MRGLSKYILTIAAFIASLTAFAQNSVVLPPVRPVQHTSPAKIQDTSQAQPQKEPTGEEEFQIAMQKQTPTSKFLHLDRSANLNYAPAYAPLAKCYAEGLGTARNDSLAYIYFRLAADNGDTDSQIEAEKRLLFGIGVEYNVKESLRSLNDLAEQGNERAASILAEYHLANADIAKAIACLTPFADKETPWAMSRLGKIHFLEHGFYYRPQLAVKLLRKAKEAGDSLATNLLIVIDSEASMYADKAIAILKGKEGGRNYKKYPFTEAPIISDKDFQRANDFLKRAADLGNAEAALIYAVNQANGNEGRLRNADEAMPYLKLTMELDPMKAPIWVDSPANHTYHRIAQVLTGACYYWGIGVVKDKDKAWEIYSDYYSKVGEDLYLPIYVSVCLKNGDGFANDPAMESMREPHFKYSYNPNWLYSEYLSDHDYKEQLTPMLIEAAMRGHKQAALTLSDCYKKGIGVDKNINLAKEWAEKASEMDDEYIWFYNMFY